MLYYTTNKEINYINKEDLIYIEEMNWKEAKEQKELFSKDCLCVCIIDEWLEDCQKHNDMCAEKKTYELFRFIDSCMLMVFLLGLIISMEDNNLFLFFIIDTLLLIGSIIMYVYISIQLKEYKELDMDSYPFNLYLPAYETEYLNLYLLENVKKYNVNLKGILHGKAYVSIYNYELTIMLYTMCPEVVKQIEDSSSVSILEFLTLENGVLKRYIKLDLEG